MSEWAQDLVKDIKRSFAVKNFGPPIWPFLLIWHETVAVRCPQAVVVVHWWWRTRSKGRRLRAAKHCAAIHKRWSWCH